MKWEKEKRSFRNGRLRVCLINDPETPCMAYLWVRKELGNGFNVETATFDCAADTGEVSGYDLTERESVWLNSLRDICAAWYDKTRVLETAKPSPSIICIRGHEHASSNAAKGCEEMPDSV